MRGYSLAEVLLALGLAAIVVLALVGLSLTALRGNQKSVDLTLADGLANSVLSQQIYQAQSTPGASFWLSNSDTNPYSQSSNSVGNQDYVLSLYVSDSNAAAGLKRCRLRVDWWGGDDRQGYGRLHTEAVRLVSLP